MTLESRTAFLPVHRGGKGSKPLRSPPLRLATTRSWSKLGAVYAKKTAKHEPADVCLSFLLIRANWEGVQEIALTICSDLSSTRTLA